LINQLVLNIFAKKQASDIEIEKFLKNILGIKPKNLEVYKMAFTHASVASKGLVGSAFNNERLEYLGDAVFNAIIAEYLFKKFPLHLEGALSEMRSKIVCRDHLNKLSQKMGIDRSLIVEPHCKSNAILGNTFEALMGALYLDKGYNKTKDIVVNKLLLTFMDLDSVLKEENNYKSKLIIWAQKNNHKIRFESQASEVTKGRKLFISRCYLNNECIAEAEGFKVKKADQLAAEKAWEQLQKNVKNGKT
jgi:ribonuclease-3